MTGPRSRQISWYEPRDITAVGRLAGGVAHDLNNMVMVISGLAGVIESGLPADDRNRKYLARIRDASDQVASLAEQLQLIGSRQVVDLEPVDLPRMMEARFPELRASLDERIELSFHCEGALPAVRSERSALLNVLDELVSNAVDAMPEGGGLTVEVRKRIVDQTIGLGEPSLKEAVEVEVRDTGMGIPSGVIEHIFEPFFTTKEKGKGAGLGLAVVCGTVRRFGGSIRCMSEPDSGTSFIVTLPPWEAASA